MKRCKGDIEFFVRILHLSDTFVSGTGQLQFSTCNEYSGIPSICLPAFSESFTYMIELVLVIFFWKVKYKNTVEYSFYDAMTKTPSDMDVALLDTISM